MQAIVRHFDSLLTSKSPLVSKSPTGFLYRAVERPFEFVLPGEKRTKQGDLGFSTRGSSEQSQGEDYRAATRRPTTQPLHDKHGDAKLNLEVAYLTARSERLQRVVSTSSSEVTAGLREEVEQALQKLKSHISPQRFQEAVQHGVEQRLLENDGFPDFDQWVKEHC
jgi:hypothetical protein